MPVNTKNLKRDAAQIPVPQYFDSDLDDFVPLDNGMYIKEAQVMLPIERQGILYRPLTLQQGVIVGTLANNATTSWQDTDGANSISVNVKSDSNTGKFTVTVVWSDDLSNIIGAEQVLASGVAVWDKSRASDTTIKAKYFKVIVINDDTATHTFSVTAGLKG
jgi:hypothetical protein